MSMRLLCLRSETCFLNSVPIVISIYCLSGFSYCQTVMLQQALKSYAVYKPYYIFDAVYTPKEMRLLREAAECGATVVSGLEMFI
jgi:hypothetical protein